MMHIIPGEIMTAFKRVIRSAPRRIGASQTKTKPISSASTGCSVSANMRERIRAYVRFTLTFSRSLWIALVV